MTEILNIDYHKKRLILKALNSKPTVIQAARELGISEKTIHKEKRRFRIVKERVKKNTFTWK